MDQDTELKNGAAAFARTLVGPAGRISFDIAVGQHLGWFSTALARGLSWHQIIELLRRASVTRDDGRPLARGHLSAVYSRQRRKVHQQPPGNAVEPPPAIGARPPKPPWQPPSSPARPRPASSTQKVQRDPEQASGTRPTEQTSTPTNSAIRSFMNRAAKQRNGNNER
ncbi:hypothetical protein [Devosia sp.]|uniref:hypothetical protein n=1 Tax=Devosia sp. TaxID=1871048 RepID=UPI0027346AFE|nr:hypothetical protein [Devosia sp.]MDP2782133.1 hypothetical protein [Devosia sp.]